MEPAGRSVETSATLAAAIPGVTAFLVRRGLDPAAAEDAVQEACIDALRVWPAGPPDNPRAWLTTVAHRRAIDAARSETARRRRELARADEPPPGEAEQGDDALALLFLCCHPSLSSASAVALTLRAVGDLSTRQIADAFMVPERTMAQRLSRARRQLAGVRLGEPGDPSRVLQVLYLIFNEGYSGDVDMALEAIRLARWLHRELPTPETAGLLALMLLQHARDAARWNEDGTVVPLPEQDRSQWDARTIAEAVRLLQAAMAAERLGPYQIQACIAALHCDAERYEETDWHQILFWYDELLSLGENPVVRLNRAVAVGHVRGFDRAMEALNEVPRPTPRYAAVVAHLHETAGLTDDAAQWYATAAAEARNAPERIQLTRRAAVLRRRH